MTTAADTPKAKRTHTNVSKVVAEVDGIRYRFSLTKSGLVVRRWHSHKTTTLAFDELLRATPIQRQLL